MGLFPKATEELQKKLDAVTAERDAEAVKVENLAAELGAVKAKNQDLEDKVTEAQGRITTLESEKLKAEADLTKFQADFETKLNAAVIERCAAAGLSNPIASDPSASSDKEMKRSDFDKLDHMARNAFFAAGGKLIN
jgi:septation ring formation regulator EzrA